MAITKYCIVINDDTNLASVLKTEDNKTVWFNSKEEALLMINSAMNNSVVKYEFRITPFTMR